MVRLSEHDGSTEGHSRRVALLAVQVGEALGLTPATLRHLAVGGLLHDIGKLAVSRRDPAQAGRADRRRVRGGQAPSAGRRASCCAALGGFPDAVPRARRPPPRAPRRRRLPARPDRRRAGRRRRASSPSATSTTRSSPTASTATHGRRAARSGCSCAESGTAFDGACVAALAGVIGERPLGLVGARARPADGAPRPAALRASHPRSPAGGARVTLRRVLSAPGAEPKRVAVVDLGSNSFRLVVFTARDGWWKRTDEIYEAVRVGEGLAATGKLGDAGHVARAGDDRGLRALLRRPAGWRAGTSTPWPRARSATPPTRRSCSTRAEPHRHRRARPLARGGGALRLPRRGQLDDAGRRRDARPRRRLDAARPRRRPPRARARLVAARARCA